MAKIGYADPPYIGQAKRHYGDHPDYAGEVDHAELLRHLNEDFDGYVLHMSAPSFDTIGHLVAEYGWEGRWMAWVKPFAAFKRNVPVAYAWEPVLVKAVRKPVVSHRMVMRDFIEEEDPDLKWALAQIEDSAVRESIAMKRGLSGAKPERVCHWAFEMLGAEPGDELVDLFPGTGAVTQAWESWQEKVALEVAA